MDNVQDFAVVDVSVVTIKVVHLRTVTVNTVLVFLRRRHYSKGNLSIESLYDLNLNVADGVLRDRA